MLKINEVKFEEVKNVVEKAEDFGQLLQTGCCTEVTGGCERPVTAINK